MAKSYIQSMLGENERILLITRQHWFVLFSAITAEILITLAIIAGVSVRRFNSRPQRLASSLCSCQSLVQYAIR